MNFGGKSLLHLMVSRENNTFLWYRATPRMLFLQTSGQNNVSHLRGNCVSFD